jgi:leader peptidase (prepilin peptidase)/N-methyltransferase
MFALYEFQDLIVPRLVDATIVIWLIYFCGAIGSFLNVVAWRMPRGEGIGGRSHCPRCATTLKSRDNVPILGWVALNGRCRTCSLPISRRYPIVEALVGISLTLIGISQIYSFALPGQRVHGHSGPLWAPSFSPILLAILTYHTVAAATLWAMTLIRIDGTRLPIRLLVFAAVAIAIPMLAFPTLAIVPWQTTRPSGWTPDGSHSDAVMRLATALVAAALFGRVLAKGLCPAADLKQDPLGVGSARLVDLIVMLAMASIVIGWQSMPAFVIAAALLSFLLGPLLRAIPINDDPRGQIAKRGTLESFAFALPVTLTLHLVFWRPLWRLPLWPSDQSDPNTILVWAMLVLAVPLFLREPTDRTDRVAPRQESDPSPDELPEHHRDGKSDDRDHRRDDAPGP